MRKLLLSVALVLGMVGGTQAQVRLDDLLVQVDYGAVDLAWFGGLYQAADFGWQRVSVKAGRGPGSMGITYLRTEHLGGGVIPREYETDGQRWVLGEEAWVLDIGYSLPLRWYARLETQGHLVFDTDKDPGAPRLTAFTRAQTNVVFYHPDGMGWLRGAPLFPSSYVGAIVNELGRVQGLVGAGTWWKGLGIYGVGFYSFNGIEDPFFPTENPDTAFGFLQDAGFNLSASYTWRDLTLKVMSSLPVRSGARGYNATLQYRFFFR